MLPMCPFGKPHRSGTHKPGQCWRCEQDERQANCEHPKEAHARDFRGILGYIDYCDACGKYL